MAAKRKTCLRCKKRKAWSKFVANRNYPNGVFCYCLDCNMAMKRDRQKRDPLGYWASKALSDVKKRGRLYRLSVTVAADELRLLWNKQRGLCKCCNVVMATSRQGRAYSDSVSVDRILPDRDYVLENVMLLCFACNKAKNGMTLKQAEFFVREMRKATKKLSK